MAHLTIPAGEPRVSYTPGASSTGPFNVTFPIFSTSDLNVMVNGVLLTSSDWVFTSTDTRTGGYQAGYITLNNATTYTVVIYRDTTRSRTSDYASGPLDIDTLNTDVDRTVARDQDLKMLLDRSLRQPLSDTAAIGRLPAKASRASAYLAFDANGDPTAVAYALSSAPVSAFMATVLDDTTAGAALTTLGVSSFAQTVLDDANAAAFLTTLGVSSFMQTVLDDTTAAAARATMSAVGKVVTQVFTGSGTYTPTSGMLYAIIECVGGGGGGGGCANSTAGNQGGAGGGGGGGYSRKCATAAQIGASQTVTVGAAGAAGTAGQNNGNAGGDTSVGALCLARGGGGGAGGAANGAPGGGAGGAIGTGDIAVRGESGGSSQNAAIVNSTFYSGRGGNAGGGFGTGGPPVGGINNFSGSPGLGYGGGGSGGWSGNGAGSAAGGAGAGGLVIITEFCS